MKKILFLLLIAQILGFGQITFEIGERVNFKNFPNSKGTDISFNTPKNWKESTESYTLSNQDENLVCCYIDKEQTLIFQLYISETPFGFLSKSKVKEMYTKETFLKQITSNPTLEVMSYNVVVIGNYPFIRMTATSGRGIQKQVNYMTFFKDKYINIVASSLTQDFDLVYPFYKLIGETVTLK